MSRASVDGSRTRQPTTLSTDYWGRIAGGPLAQEVFSGFPYGSLTTRKPHRFPC